MTSIRFARPFAFIAIPFCLLALSCTSEDKSKEDTWSYHRADAASSNYAPIDQINTSNVDNLENAWTFEIKDMPKDARPGLSQCTPIIVDGTLYTVSAKGWLYALDAKTGEQIWSFDPFDGGEGGGTVRGVSYWESGDDNRIIFGSGDRLLAVE